MSYIKLIKNIIKQMNTNVLKNILVTNIEFQLEKFNLEKLENISKDGIEAYYYKNEDIKDIFLSYNLTVKKNVVIKNLNKDYSSLYGYKYLNIYISEIIDLEKYFEDIMIEYFKDIYGKHLFIESNINSLQESISKVNIENFTFIDYLEYSKIFCSLRTINFHNCTFNNEWTHINSKEILYSNCTFTEYSHINQSEIKVEVDSLLFFNCNFKKIQCEGIHFRKRLFKNNNLHKYNKIDLLSFINCEFDSKFIFTRYDENKKKEYFSIDKINLDNSTFNSKFKLQFCIIKNASFYNTKFIDLADFYQSKFEKVNFERTDFENISVFSEVDFKCDVYFKYTKFFKKAIFRDTVISEEYSLDLRNSIFNDEANFLDITSKCRKDDNGNFIGDVTDIKVKNRETARVIKNMYDNSNNIIEANRFYALEMKEREKELTWKDFFLDKLVFSFHGISSNHSQDWLLSLFWILNLSFIYFVLNNNINDSTNNLHKLDYLLISTFFIMFIGTIINYLKKHLGNWLLLIISVFNYQIYSYICPNASINEFSKNINPFSMMTPNYDLNFGELIYKIIIAYLIYQLIISIRQNTRRK